MPPRAKEMLNETKGSLPPLPEAKDSTNGADVIGVTHGADDQATNVPALLPILPLRSIVVFPGTVVPLTVGRASSRRLLEESLPQSKMIGLIAQRDPEQEEPGPNDLFQ